MDDKEKQFVNDLLDALLRNYSGSEPRGGLEGRILAGVRARQRERRHRVAWLNAFAISGLAVAVVGLVGFVALRGGLRRAATPPAIANHPAKQAAPAVATISPPVKLPVPYGTPRHAELALVEWRPQQFPTQRPLSEEEKLLLAYVQALKGSAAAPEPNPQQEAEPAKAIPPLSIAAIKIEPLSPEEEGDGK